MEFNEKINVMMKYNFEEFKKLSNYRQELKNKKKIFERENPIEYSKFRNYSVQVAGWIHWDNREQYLQLIKDFLNLKITATEFDKLFSAKVEFLETKSRNLIDDQNFEELKLIKPNSASFEFSEIISEIYLCCNEFYPNFPEEERGEIPFAKTDDQLIEAVMILADKLGLD